MEKTIFRSKYKRFLKLLRQVREERGITQAHVAKRLKTSQSMYSKMESGQTRIDVVQLDDICKAIGIDLADFVNLFKRKKR